MNKPVSEIIKRCWTRLATKAKSQLNHHHPCRPENMLMLVGDLPAVKTIRLQSIFAQERRPANLMAVLERTTTHYLYGK